MTAVAASRSEAKEDDDEGSDDDEETLLLFGMRRHISDLDKRISAIAPLWSVPVDEGAGLDRCIRYATALMLADADDDRVKYCDYSGFAHSRIILILVLVLVLVLVMLVLL